jgi:hypothetical protein
VSAGCLEYPDAVATARRPNVDRAVVELVRELAAPDDGHLDRAVLAMRLAATAEQLARTEVERARKAGATWQDVGDAFGTNRQAAHERFREGPGGGRSRLTRRRRSSQSNSDSSG